METTLEVIMGWKVTDDKNSAWLLKEKNDIFYFVNKIENDTCGANCS